jgi:hypothetical protein
MGSFGGLDHVAEEFDINCSLEITVSEVQNGQVSLKLRLLRVKAEGFREDAQQAIFGGTVLKAHDYLRLDAGSVISYEGLKVQVRVEDE